MLTFESSAHIYKWNDSPVLSVTQVLESTGFIDKTHYTEECRERGTIVHRLTHEYDDGELEEEAVYPEYRPYVYAWIKFRKETGFTPSMIEVPLYSKYGFAGTPDRYGQFNGKGVGVIPDIKTGAPETFWPLQSGGYEQLIMESLPKDEKPFLIKRMCVQLKDDGKYTIHPHENPMDRKIFLGLVAGANYKRNGGK